MLITVQPTKPPPSSALFSNMRYFSGSFGWNKSTNLETCLVTFFKLHTNKARSFKGTCDELLQRLTKDDDAEGLPDSALQHLDTADVSTHFNDEVFKALQLMASCDPESHETAMPADSCGNRELLHPARLCLHESDQDSSVTSLNIKVLVSTMDMALWQEFCLRT